ncbi:hypothetical protein CRG98_017755, partial [Punica granatum]
MYIRQRGDGVRFYPLSQPISWSSSVAERNSSSGGRREREVATARTAKDVSPHEFVKAYAAHLKRLA